MALSEALTSRLRLPLIAAPMLRISGPELVIAACQSGIIGAFPTANARTVEQLDEWLTAISTAGSIAPYCANLIIKQPALADHLACLIEHRTEIVVTSVGSPAAVVEPLHRIGALVLADVATLAHARKAVATGVDGLVLLTAGSGGQTGCMNPFAFVRGVREFYDGLVVLAGGMSDGHALRAAITLGCDLGYMGTRFIATTESRASPEYRSMLVSSSMDDILLTSAFTGLPTSMLVPAIRAAGLDPSMLNEQITVASAAELYGGRSDRGGPRRWQDIFSAGHTVSAIDEIGRVSDLIDQLSREYEDR